MSGIGILFAAYFGQQFEQTQWDSYKFIFSGMALFCGFPCNHKPQQIFNRIGYVFVLFGCALYVIVVASTFATFGIFRFFEPKIDSVSIFLNGNYDLIGDPFAFTKLHDTVRSS